MMLQLLFRRGPLRPTRLAALLGMTESQVSRELNYLESKALVTRSIDATDKRCFNIALTDAGLPIVRPQGGSDGLA